MRDVEDVVPYEESSISRVFGFCKRRKLILAVDSKTTFVGGDVLDAPLSIAKAPPIALICAVGGASIVASLLFAIQFAEQHLFILQKVESKQKDNYAYNRTENGIHYYDFGCTHSFKGHKH